MYMYVYIYIYIYIYIHLYIFVHPSNLKPGTGRLARLLQVEEFTMIRWEEESEGVGGGMARDTYEMTSLMRFLFLYLMG